jgi:hypothetical protein
VNIENGKTIRNINRVIVHPNYTGLSNKIDFDVALMKLQSPVEFSNEIIPICLPAQGHNLASLGAQGTVIGWSKNDGLKHIFSS